ncbi:MAG: hypothetical protein ACLP5H_14960 [Desulfomonilaceae bacterium]
MEMSEQERNEKARIFDLLVHHYGSGARVLNQRNHTNVYADERGTYDLRGIEEKFLDPKTGKLSPQALKHWTLLDKTLDYLRTRYKIFTSGNIYTTCSIHSWFGKTPPPLKRLHYLNKVRAYIQYIGTVAFTCDSRHCTWEQCALHCRKKTKKKDFGQIKFDIFNLLHILDAVEHGLPYPRRRHNLGHYSKMLAEEWNEEVKALKSGSGEDRGGQRYPKYKGHIVKKKALIRALKKPTKNPALTGEFVKTLLHLINSSPLEDITSTMKSDEEYHLHAETSYTVMQLGAAAKLWLYIWMRCEEASSRIDLNIRDCEQTLDIARSRIYVYREVLERLGCLNTDKQGRVSVSVLREKP